jgi:RNA polymerase sigma factor (sigma-70 family)
MEPQLRDQEEPAEGWEEVVSAHDLWLRRRMRDTMRRVGLRPRPEEVGDNVQEVYCRLLEGGPRRLRLLCRSHRRGVLGYLGKVAESVVLDEVRAGRAVKRRRIHSGLRIADPEGNPERVLLRSERRRLLLRHLVHLADLEGVSRRDLRLLWLAVVEGWRSRELALLFELTPRTVDTRLHGIRKRLAQAGLELRRR